jgi:SAM-dependent methyltransferase
MQGRGASATALPAASGSVHADARRVAFLSADGIVLSATLRGLGQLGLLDRDSAVAERALREHYAAPDAPGFGYLRGALRGLAAQGWLREPPGFDPGEISLALSEEGAAAAVNWDRYRALGRFLAELSADVHDGWSAPWSKSATRALLEQLPLCEQRWSLDPATPAGTRELIRFHLDGAFAAPAIVWLGASGALGEDGPRLPAGELGEGMARMLTSLGWIDDEGAWTPQGARTRLFPAQYGAVCSYLPMFARLPQLLRGELVVEPGAGEWHVDRALNVRASAAAHGNYFADADDIFRDLFDREPVSEQPQFVADMGCGDGSWLAHIHELVASRTRRGLQLESSPLLMVGIDSSPAALAVARGVLDTAGVPSLLIEGDVGDPDALASALTEHGLSMADGLHVRSFLDHNRAVAGSGGGGGEATGAYVGANGLAVGGELVERDLLHHLRRWQPHVGRHGLVLLEVHCVAPAIARRHVGALHSIAFDTYHAYSHQYPIDHPLFMRACREAGLEPLGYAEGQYPSSRPFVAVSINRLLARERGELLPAIEPGRDPAGGWRPPAAIELDDGRALHHYLYAGGDLARPRPWASAATGYVVRGALERIESRLAGAAAGESIRVLDYGTGTGFAAIELLKACRERGIEQRLAGRGVELELHLADLPSSWFAQGFELLRDCSWVRFHALRDEAGGFRPLRELVGDEPVDVVMANMVFHLVPPDALTTLAAEVASVLGPDGILVWSAPDLGPAGPYSVLFHDPNRAVRRRWLQLLDGAQNERGGPPPPRTREAAELARALTPDQRRQAAARAERRILPRANQIDEVEEALASALAGTVETRTYEILEREVLDGLLIPSNQAEQLAEIEDRTLREDVIGELMLGEVLPALGAGPAGTGLGLNLQWTFGRASRR